MKSLKTLVFCCAATLLSFSAQAWESLSDIPYKIQLKVGNKVIESGSPRIIYTPQLSELTGGKRAVAYCFEKQATFAKIKDNFYSVNGNARSLYGSVIVVRGIEYNVIDAREGPLADKNMSVALMSLIREANLVCN